MLAIRLHMDAEVLVMFRISEAVVFLQSVDFRLADRWNLALVSVKNGETFDCRSIAANRTEGGDQVPGLYPFF